MDAVVADFVGILRLELRLFRTPHHEESVCETTWSSIVLKGLASAEKL